MTNEANFLSPKVSHIKWARKVAHQIATSAPSIASVLGYLRDKFNVDNIDNLDLDDTDFFSDSDSDLGFSDIDDHLEPCFKHPCAIKNKVKSDTKHVFIGNTAEPQMSLPLDALKSQLEAKLKTQYLRNYSL